MMDIRRIVLFMALAIVGLFLWNAWQIEYLAQTATTAPQTQPLTRNNNALMPALSGALDNQEIIAPTAAIAPKNTRVIDVKTDVLAVTIDLEQGDIINSLLLAYPISVADNKPFPLLYNQSLERYIATSSLLTLNNQTVAPLQINFTADKSVYQMSPNEEQLVVVLTGKDASNNPELMVKKEFIFTKGSYLVTVKYHIVNQSNQPETLYFNTQLVQSSPKEDKSSIFHVGSYTGASYSDPQKNHYKKVSFSDMNKANLDVAVKNGWIAMQQHYFLSAWIPDLKSLDNKFYTRAEHNNYTIGMVSAPLIIDAKQQQSVSANLYMGPEITHILKGIAPSLDLTVDYGILWFVSSLLFSLMKLIFQVVGNWGWSIILVTVLIKLAFYRLSATSYKSMAGMRKLQPKLAALKERYGDDKAKISQATMELYRQEKVNPLGGCLPIIIQIPVFIALYWVLLESVELRQAPFILWIKDLASPDPYHVLPLIMGATMFIQQKLNPAPPDPMQAKIMMFLPLLFTGLFWNFPAGLVLYWIVNNTLSILQQWYITQKYTDDKPTKKLITVAK